MAATILIGEVDADLRHTFTRLFTRAGYTVLTAPDAHTALDTAVRETPDLVILNLFGDDGPEVCRALHADARTAGTPIIVMTADLYPDAVAAARAGAEDYLTKPFDNANLLDHAHALLQNAAATHRRPVGTHTPPARLGRARRPPAVPVPTAAPSGLGPLAHNLAALAETPEDAVTLDTQLATIAQLAVDRVAAVDYASITALRDDTPTTVAANSDLARAVDHAQYTAGGGPCVQALADAAPVAVDAIATTMTWPGFRDTAVKLGLQASVSIPLITGSGATLAVLNLHGRDAAAMAPLIIGVWAVYDPDRPMPAGTSDPMPALEAGAEELLTGFARALEVRATIQCAIALIINRANATAANAYLRLRAHAAATGTSLSTAASTLIAHPTLNPPDTTRA
ncbi:response regulator [Actinoplanes sp. NPDC023801]|uniref:response regulator transcription factor n=1 Tax=Actinoplanes sp. NPDC023801 TaxID=3154595 RepID=UPI0033CEE5E8